MDDDLAKRYFNCSDRERAVFEAGIKLGSIFHQYVGAPVSESSAEALERAIEAGARVQPCVHSVEARLDRKMIRESASHFGYATVDGRMLSVRLVVRCGSAEALCRMEYIEALRYPLMYVERVGPASK